MLSNTNKNTIYNLLSTFMAQGINFLSIPLFTRLLGKEQYGMYSLFYSWVIVINCVLGLGVNSSLGTGRFTFEDKYEEFKRSSFLLVLVINTGLFIVWVSFCRQLSDIFDYEEWIIIIMFLAAFAYNIIVFFQQCCIFEKKARTNFIITTVTVISSLVLSLIMINGQSVANKYLGRVCGFSFAYICCAVVVSFFILKGNGIKIKQQYAKYSLCIGIPLIFNALSQNVLSQSDRLMMKMFGVSYSDIGIYSVFYSFGSVIIIVVQALNMTWQPIYYEHISKKTWGDFNRQAKNFIELVTVIFVGFLMLSREVVVLWGGQDYCQGREIIPVLVLAFYFIFITQLYTNFETFYKKTVLITTGSILGAIVNILMNCLLITRYGMFGAAIATMMSYAFLVGLHILFVKRKIKESFELDEKLLIVSLLIVIVASVLYYVLGNAVLLRWIIGLSAGVYELFSLWRRKVIF